MQEVELAQPTLIRTRGAGTETKESLVDVPSLPMVPEGEHLAQREVNLEVDSADSVMLKPVKPKTNWLAVILTLCFAVLLCFTSYFGLSGVVFAIEKKTVLPGLFWGFLAGLPVLILLGLLVYRLFKPGPLIYRFDNASSLVMVLQQQGFKSKPGIVTTYRLQDVLAVQLLNRYYQVLNSSRAAIDKTRLANSYELNLVLRSNQRPRVHLAVHSDWRWMRQAGTRLAEFMNVPVIDQLCQS